VGVDLEVDAAGGELTVTAEASTHAETGVEMEAMIACAVAALTVYDMVKGVERGVEIGPIGLISKTGGKADWRRSG
jgi:cyclic pyranopterin phosphate synthase